MILGAAILGALVTVWVALRYGADWRCAWRRHPLEHSRLVAHAGRSSLVRRSCPCGVRHEVARVYHAPA